MSDATELVILRQDIRDEDGALYRRGRRRIPETLAERLTTSIGRRIEEPAEEPGATDAAALLAEEEGVDLARVEGTGKDGRIGVADVRAFLAEQEEGGGEGGEE